MQKALLAMFIFSIFLFAGCTQTNPQENTSGLSNMTNPASTNCINLGGTLEIRNEQAGEVGYCTLPNGTICEEWALFRGDCCDLSEKQLAIRFIEKNSSTYKYDGIAGSIKFLNQTTLPYSESFYFSFQSAHPGYGSRSNQSFAQKITNHTMNVQVSNAKVSYAITDDVFDEISDSSICMMFSAVIEVCGKDGFTYQHPCFAKINGVEMLHGGKCNQSESATVGIANPASANCIKLGGKLEIKDEEGGQVGYCLLPDTTVCEEWALYRGECGEKYLGGAGCTHSYAPVCSMSGKTYTNTCFLTVANEQISHYGECSGGNASDIYYTGNSSKECLGKNISCKAGYISFIDYTSCGCKKLAEMSQALCEASNGNWNDCGSACRGVPEGTVCTMQCVQYCECGGFAGFACPEGYSCTDYLPKGAVDAMGVCKLAQAQ